MDQLKARLRELLANHDFRDPEVLRGGWNGDDPVWRFLAVAFVWGEGYGVHPRVFGVTDKLGRSEFYALHGRDMAEIEVSAVADRIVAAANSGFAAYPPLSWEELLRLAQ